MKRKFGVDENYQCTLKNVKSSWRKSVDMLRSEGFLNVKEKKPGRPWKLEKNEHKSIEE